MSQTASTTAPRLSAQEPWLGLESYTEEDKALFFGRDKEADELVRMIRRETLTVLFGPAGTGKTSLLNAGVFPKLRREYFLPVSIRLDHSPQSPPPDRQVRHVLMDAVRGSALEEEAAGAPQVPSGEESLWEYLHRVEFWNQRNQLVTPVLFFDQFEEVFTLGKDRPATVTFLDELADLVENYVPEAFRQRVEQAGSSPPWLERRRYKIVLSLREDFVHRLDSLRKAMPSVMHNRYPLAPMNGDQALEAVLKPGHEIVSEPVANQIVRFVAAADRAGEQNPNSDRGTPLAGLQVEPALLSLVCREHNRRRLDQGSAMITSAQIEAAQTDILNDFYERSCQGIPREGRVFIEDRLLTATGYRSTAPLDDALQSGLSQADIDTLVDRRLIRIEYRLGRPHVELIHDRLTGVVTASRNARQEQERREAGERARQEQLREERLRKARLQALWFGLAAVLCLVFAFIAAYYSAKAGRASRESTARELAAYAKGSISEDPERSLALAIEAVETTSRRGQPVIAQAEESLHRAILSSHLERVFPHKDKVYAVAFSPDGRVLATASEDKTATLWDTRSGNVLGHVQHQDSVTAVAFSPDGRRLATASADKTAKVWDAVSGKEEWTLSGHQGWVSAVTFSPAGDRLATASWDGRVMLWDAHTGARLRVLTRPGPGNQQPVRSVAFSPDGTRLAAAGDDGLLLVWNVRAGGLLKAIPQEGPVYGVAFSPDGKRVATASGSGALIVWDPDTGKAVLTVRGHPVYIQALAFSPDGKSIATASGDKTAKVWDTATGREVFTLNGHTDVLGGVAFSPDGQYLATASADRTARLWNAAAIRGEVLQLREGGAALAFRPDGERLATTAADQTAGIWDIGSHIRKPIFRGHTDLVTSVTFSSDGATLATASGDWTARLWKAASGEQTHVLAGHQDYVFAVAFSPDGRFVATASGDLTAKIWDPKTGAELRTLRNHRDAVSGVAFSPDGKYVATASRDMTARLWDPFTGRELKELKHQDQVAAVAFSPKGKLIATASQGGTRLWDYSGKELPAWNTPALALAFSPDGRRLVTAGPEGTLSLWDVDSGGAILSFQGHRGAVFAVAFSPDGKRLASAGQDGTVQVYAMDPVELLRVAKSRLTRSLTPEECRAYPGACVNNAGSR